MDVYSIAYYVRDVVGRCGDSEIQDATALTDVDSGLQMAVSPYSALSASSMTAASKDPQCSGGLAVTVTGVSGHSGVQRYGVSK